MTLLENTDINHQTPRAPLVRPAVNIKVLNINPHHAQIPICRTLDLIDMLERSDSLTLIVPVSMMANCH